jgi:hypothetical protein
MSANGQTDEFKTRRLTSLQLANQDDPGRLPPAQWRKRVANCANAPRLGTCGPEEDQMHLQIVMNMSGDTRHQFDPDDASAMAEAERRFGEFD